MVTFGFALADRRIRDCGERSLVCSCDGVAAEEVQLSVGLAGTESCLELRLVAEETQQAIRNCLCILRRCRDRDVTLWQVSVDCPACGDQTGRTGEQCFGEHHSETFAMRDEREGGTGIHQPLHVIMRDLSAKPDMPGCVSVCEALKRCSGPVIAAANDFEHDLRCLGRNETDCADQAFGILVGVVAQMKGSADDRGGVGRCHEIVCRAGAG